MGRRLGMLKRRLEEVGEKTGGRWGEDWGY
jgi:hypothetical protein